MLSFKKAEHLKLEKDIELLFGAGSRASTVYPIRAVWRLVPATDGVRVRVLVSVAKKRLRHAVDRNRTKRILREAYRIHKDTVWSAVPEGYTLHIAFLWLVSGETGTFAQVEKSMFRLLNMVKERTMYK